MGTEIWAIAMVKDESDIVGTTVSHMAAQVDHVLVADNSSTDGTRELLDALPCDVVDEERVGYYQSERMSELAAVARRLGAEWVVPFDADEVWLPDEGRIADVLAHMPDEAMVCHATVFDHVAVPDEALSSWRRAEPLPLHKVACRAVEGLMIHQGNHDASFPGVEWPLRVGNALEIRHFPYRSPEQFIRKVRNGYAAYAATDLPETTGQHWREYGRLTDEQLREHFHRWFHSSDPESDGLIHDPCPLSASSPGAAAAPTVTEP